MSLWGLFSNKWASYWQLFYKSLVYLSPALQKSNSFAPKFSNIVMEVYMLGVIFQHLAKLTHVAPLWPTQQSAWHAQMVCTQKCYDTCWDGTMWHVVAHEDKCYSSPVAGCLTGTRNNLHEEEL